MSVAANVRPTAATSLPPAQRSDLPKNAQRKFDAYLDLLAKWNRAFNLTAIRERPQMVTHHLHDALAVLPFLPQARRLRLLDVGTGGGIPGIPLAIARPEWQVVLLDANQKKVTFVTQAIIELELANARAVASRVEDYVADAPFDVVISRAFSDLPTFARLAMRHVSPDGALVAMKGVLPEDEIAQLPADVEVIETPALGVPGLDATRHLVIMKQRIGAPR